MVVAIKRVYEVVGGNDGQRVLVDRLWPRGLSKESAHVDVWLRDIAPSNDLRKWFSHDPEKWITFQERYVQELNANKQVVDVLRALIRQGKVTLLYGSKDEDHNQAVVLKIYLGQQ